MKLLIDCDYIVYKCCAAAETEMDFGDDVIVVTSNFSDAMKCVQRDLDRIQNELGSFDDEMILFLQVLKILEKNSARIQGSSTTKKALWIQTCHTGIKENYKVILKDTLEADDALGIYATKYPGNIIVSPDKDMRQIPGKLYDFKETVEITPDEGARWHLIQTMAGDNTDGYSGVPGIGVKKAEKIFNEKGYTWKAVVETFVEKELTEQDALINAQLARILTTDDYDHEKREPILWKPLGQYKINPPSGSGNERNPVSSV